MLFSYRLKLTNEGGSFRFFNPPLGFFRLFVHPSSFFTITIFLIHSFNSEFPHPEQPRLRFARRSKPNQTKEPSSDDDDSLQDEEEFIPEKKGMEGELFWSLIIIIDDDV